MPNIKREEMEIIRRLTIDIEDGVKKVQARRASTHDVKQIADDAHHIFQILNQVWQRPD